MTKYRARVDAPRNSTYPHVIDDYGWRAGTLPLTLTIVYVSFGARARDSCDSGIARIAPQHDLFCPPTRGKRHDMRRWDTTQPGVYLCLKIFSYKYTIVFLKQLIKNCYYSRSCNSPYLYFFFLTDHNICGDEAGSVRCSFLVDSIDFCGKVQCDADLTC